MLMHIARIKPDLRFFSLSKVSDSWGQGRCQKTFAQVKLMTGQNFCWGMAKFTLEQQVTIYLRHFPT